jgi:hypothetical protein
MIGWPRWAVCSLLPALALLLPRLGHTCAACACGDPTLTVLGTERAFAGRLRLGLEARHRTDAIGQPGVDRIELSEQRLTLQAALSPSDRTTILLGVPLLQREIRYVNEARTTLRALGDIELHGRFEIWQNRPVKPAHRLALVGGLSLPTASTDGGDLPAEARAGGPIEPRLGLTWISVAGPWSFYGSLLGSWPLAGDAPDRPSPSARATLVGQYQLLPALALRAGSDLRASGADHEDGEPERDSGGLIGFVLVEAVGEVWTDWLVSLGLRVPVLDALRGYHDEGFIATLGLVVDWGW